MAHRHADSLRSETPAGVIQEVYALSLGHFVARALMFEAAATVGLDGDRLSFTGCFQICHFPVRSEAKYADLPSPMKLGSTSLDLS